MKLAISENMHIKWNYIPKLFGIWNQLQFQSISHATFPPKCLYTHHQGTQEDDHRCLKATTTSIGERSSLQEDMGVSLNGGTPKTPQNDNF